MPGIAGRSATTTGGTVATAGRRVGAVVGRGAGVWVGGSGSAVLVAVGGTGVGDKVAGAGSVGVKVGGTEVALGGGAVGDASRVGTGSASVGWAGSRVGVNATMASRVRAAGVRVSAGRGRVAAKNQIGGNCQDAERSDQQRTPAVWPGSGLDFPDGLRLRGRRARSRSVGGLSRGLNRGGRCSGRPAEMTKPSR